MTIIKLLKQILYKCSEYANCISSGDGVYIILSACRLILVLEQTAELPRRNAQFDDESQECENFLNDELSRGELFNLMNEIKHLIDV